MPNITRNFVAGRMNKVVDERLVPNGEYIDALNIRMGSTENAEIGVIENSKGNEQLTSLLYIDGTPLSPSALCIGALDDTANDTIYWFVHDPAFTPITPYPAITGKLDLIVSYNIDSGLLQYHVISINDGGGANTTLNFNPKYTITGVNLVDELLFFTDDWNQPRFININRNYAYPDAITGVDDPILGEALLVIKKPPMSSPTIQPYKSLGDETFMSDRFISFAYRYRYADGEYSATSQWSNVSFSPRPFFFDISTWLNGGMENEFNACNVTYNSGGPLVVGIDLLFKEANSNIVKVIEKIDKAKQGLSNNTNYTFSFENSKIFTVLPESELLRLYDNVPLLSKAQTVMGNRLMYGNYLEGYDLIDQNGFPTNISYVVDGESLSAEETALFATTTSGVYSIDPLSPGLTVNNSKILILLNNLQLKTGAQFSFDIVFEHQQWSGQIPYPTTTTQQAVASFTFILPQDYATPTDMVNSAEFQAAIGTISNIQTVPNSCSGGTFTDVVNCAVPTTLGPLQKINSGITAISQPASASVATVVIPVPPITGDFLVVQLPAMQFVDSLVTPTQTVYEYYKVLTVNAVFQDFSVPASLHSNRGYEVGMVYMDEFGRSTTALVSPNNTVHFPCSTSPFINKLRVTIPTNQRAPEWAKKYKFVIKADTENYETIYSNLWYTDASNTTTAWFLLEGENARKIEVGDKLTVKADTSGALYDCVNVTVLEKEAKPQGGVGPAPSTSPPGVYMKISTVDLYTAASPNAVFQRSNYFEVPHSFISGGYATNNAWTSIPMHDGTSNITIPAGSKIVMDIEMWRNGGMSGCKEVRYKYAKSFVASTTYPNFKAWFEGDGINTTINSGTALSTATCGTYTNYYDASILPTGVIVNGIPNNVIDYAGNHPFTCEFYWTWWDAGGGKLNLIVTSTEACNGDRKPNDRKSKIRGTVTIYRAIDTFIFETQPQDALPDVFYENNMSYDIDVTTGEHLGGPGDTSQDFATNTPAIIDTKFFNCFSFGNGAESYKAFDSAVGRSFNLGERVTSVAAQDYRAVRRYADITYSGIFNNESNVNKLNEFNLGLINYKTLEDSFGRIFRLDGRETDVLVLQEDKISYVLAGKNLLSDAAAGGAITSVPEVLGTQIARTEKYGISFHPESYIHWGYDRYFTDAKRGAVLQLKGNSYNSDQLRVISEQGMRTWFRDTFKDSFFTQKLGGFDPYMNEYVLSSNERPIPFNPACVDCNTSTTFIVSNPVFSGKDPVQQYCVNLGIDIGTSQVQWTINSLTPGSYAQVEVAYNGGVIQSTVENSVGTYSFTFNKNVSNVDTAEIFIYMQGNISLTINVGCPVTQSVNIVEIVLTSDYEAGQTIHTEYKYIDGLYFSPIQQSLVTFTSGLSNPLVSRYNISTGVVGSPGFPTDGSTQFIQTNKITPDTFDFDINNDKLRWYRSPILYNNTAVDINTVVSLSTNLTVSNSGNVFYGSFTVPAGVSNDYIYLIWDFRDSIGVELCYSSDQADTCCNCETCDFENECIRIGVTNTDDTNPAGIFLPNGVCGDPTPVSIPIDPLTTEYLCVNYPVEVVLGNPLITILECGGCEVCLQDCSMYKVDNITEDVEVEYTDCSDVRTSVFLTTLATSYVFCGKTAVFPIINSGSADITYHRCGCCETVGCYRSDVIDTTSGMPTLVSITVNGTLYNATGPIYINDAVSMTNFLNTVLGAQCVPIGEYSTSVPSPGEIEIYLKYVCCSFDNIVVLINGLETGFVFNEIACSPAYIPPVS